MTDLLLWAREHFEVSEERGAELTVRCPFHEDRNPSAGVNTETACFHCFACGSTVPGKLTEVAALKGWPPPPIGNGHATVKKANDWPYWEHPELLRYRFKYLDAEGRLVLEVHRYEGAGVPGGKVTRPWNPATGRYELPKGLKVPLYNRRAFMEAAEAAAPVALAEGEKKSDAVSKLGIPCACNQGGSSNWKDELLEGLPGGAKVVVFPDADDAGTLWCNRVCASLEAHGGEAYIPPLEFKHGSGEDIYDWLAAEDPFAVEDRFGELVANAARWQPPEAPAKEAAHELEPTRDRGHAHELEALFRDQYRWANHRGRWMRWTGAQWRAITDERMATTSTDTLRRTYSGRLGQTKEKSEIARLLALLSDICSSARITGTLFFLKGCEGFDTDSAEWDARPWELNCRNGEIDLSSGELHPHDAQHLHTKFAPVDYDPQAPAPAWQKHLELFIPNGNIRRQVQRDLGLSLVGSAQDNRLPIWFGAGGNGRSTTQEVLQRCLGDYVLTAAANLLIRTKHEQHPTSIADLAGSRLVFSSEIGEGNQLDEALVKRLTGGERKRAHFMHQDNFSFDQSFMIFLIVNNKPEISGCDDGIWRRISLVPWEIKIPDSLKRPQEEVITSLVEEGAGVLRWLVEGLADWRADHYWTAPEVTVATRAYRNEEDRFSAFFLACTEDRRGAWTSTADLRAAYDAWCLREGEQPGSEEDFRKRLKRSGKTAKKAAGTGTRGWAGIVLKDRPDPSESLEIVTSDPDGTDHETPGAALCGTLPHSPPYVVAHERTGTSAAHRRTAAPSDPPEVDDGIPF